MSTAIRPNASFQPAAYRRCIAEMFGTLPPDAQRDLVEKLGVLPRHIHALAQQGLISDR